MLTDALGSTVALGDNTGTLQTQYTYEPFGYTTIAGQANSNSYKYTGREEDGTGLYYYRARYYHPRLERFIAEDPIGFEGGDLNLYLYVQNAPLSFTDPTGEFVWVPFVIGGALLAGSNSSSFQNAAASAAQYWADAQNQTNNSLMYGLYGLLGGTASLADSCSIGKTSLVLGAGYTGGFTAINSFKFALHDPHHYFSLLGKNMPHLQMNWWQPGVAGSGQVFCVPIPTSVYRYLKQ